MSTFHVVALLMVLTALFSYANNRVVRLNASIGVMLIAMVLSLALISVGEFSAPLRGLAAGFLSRIPFTEALLDWMLGFLLFAGALTVDMHELSRQRAVTALLATLGTLGSMGLVGLLAWGVLWFLRPPLPLPACFLFGALISPTDPVAVLSFMRRAKAPKTIETIIAAESLFNDGVGVVLFFTFLAMIAAAPGHDPSWLTTARLLLQQSVGGAVLGLATGYAVYRMLRSSDGFELEVIMTVALVMGAYSLADLLHVSGPIAVVVAGLLIGNRARDITRNAITSDEIFEFWAVVEEVLNAVLFVLIGLEVLVTPYTPRRLLAALVAIPIVLLARWLSVSGSVLLLGPRSKRPPALVAILTWGGLRGGLPIAMALIIPAGTVHDQIVAITYVVVAFSILVQGMSLRPLVARWTAPAGVRNIVVGR